MELSVIIPFVVMRLNAIFNKIIEKCSLNHLHAIAAICDKLNVVLDMCYDLIKVKRICRFPVNLYTLIK